MDQRIKKRWIKALRSGEYEQGRGQLCKDNKFCCLGVLYDIEHDGDWIYDPLGREIVVDGDTYIDGCWTTDGGNPFSYGQNLGIGISTLATLINMNDEDSSFSKIANWIEKHL